MKNDYVVKSFRLHKKKDKHLIELLKEFSENKTLSIKMREIVEIYFNFREREKNQLLSTLISIEQTVKDLKSTGVQVYQSSGSSQSQQTAFVPVISREQKSIGELMGGLIDMGDDDLDLSL